MSDRHLIDLSLLHMLPEYLAARGIAAGPLLARAGIAAPTGPWSGQMVTRGQICTLLEETSRRLGAAAVGLDLATDARPADLGATGRAIFSADTLRGCLEAHLRTMPSLQSGLVRKPACARDPAANPRRSAVPKHGSPRRRGPGGPNGPCPA